MAVLTQPIAVAGTSTPAYFDGATAGASWDGTPDASTSTRAAVGPADAGSMTLTVLDAVDFSEGGGEVLIGEEVITYTSVDDEASVIYLDTPLANTYPEGQRVELYPLSHERLAQVMVGDTDETVQAVIPHALWDRVTDGIRDEGAGEVVELELVNTDWFITNIAGAKPVVDGGYLDEETTPPETLMDGSLYGTIGFVDGGFVAGDLLGARVEMSAAGLGAFDADNLQTFQVDALTGNVTTVGMYASALTPTTPHVVIGDLAGTGATRSFMYFYTGEELAADGSAVADYAPGEVSSGIDVDGTRYVRLRSPDMPGINQGELTVRSSVNAATRPTLGWAGDIRLRGDAGTVYALNAAGADAALTIKGSALVLDVPNGTMRLADNGAGGNRLRSRDTTDSARRHLELESDTLMFDVAGGNLVLRGNVPGAMSARGQLRAYTGDVALVWSGNDVISVTNTAGGGYQPIAASSFNVNSDADGKTELATVEPTDALRALAGTPVYDYTRRDNGHRQRGVLAQDMQARIPIAVIEDESGSLNMDLYGLVTTNVAAIQALVGRLEQVEAKTAQLPTPRTAKP